MPTRVGNPVQFKKMDVEVGDLIKDHFVIYFTFRDLDHNVIEVHD